MCSFFSHTLAEIVSRLSHYLDASYERLRGSRTSLDQQIGLVGNIRRNPLRLIFVEQLRR